MLARLRKFGEKWLSGFDDAQKKPAKIWITFILIGLIIIILAVSVYKQRSILLSYDWHIRLQPLLLAFIIFSATLFIASMVWGYILNNISLKLGYPQHIYYYVISNLAKRIPGTVWYVASRVQMYAGEGIPVAVTTLASGVEMLFIVLAGIITILLFSTQIIIRYHLSPLIFVVIFILGILLIQPRVIRWILKLFKIDTVKIDYKLIIVGVLAYLFSWILGGILLFEIANIIYPIPLAQIGYVIGCWTIVGTLSFLFLFSPTNFGITELGLSFLLSSIVPFSIAVVIAVFFRILIIIFELIWAGVMLVINKLRGGH